MEILLVEKEKDWIDKEIFTLECIYILSAYLLFHVILGYEIKIYHFRDNYV